MMSLQQIRRFFVTIILTIMLAITIAFDFGTTNSWAATLPTQSQTQIASMNRAKAVTKNIEGKAQEAIGNMTGDPKDQMMGKAKQVESQARNAAEDIAFLIHKRYIPDPEQLNQQRFKCAAQMRELLYKRPDEVKRAGKSSHKEH